MRKQKRKHLRRYKLRKPFTLKGQIVIPEFTRAGLEYLFSGGEHASK